MAGIFSPAHALTQDALEILPKIDGANEDQAIRRSLIRMLAVVLDLDISAGAAANFGWQKENLLEILIRLFCDKLLRNPAPRYAQKIRWT